MFIGVQNRGVWNLLSGRVFSSIQMKRICAKNDMGENAYRKETSEHKKAGKAMLNKSKTFFAAFAPNAMA